MCGSFRRAVSKGLLYERSRTTYFRGLDELGNEPVCLSFETRRSTKGVDHCSFHKAI